MFGKGNGQPVAAKGGVSNAKIDEILAVCDEICQGQPVAAKGGVSNAKIDEILAGQYGTDPGHIQLANLRVHDIEAHDQGLVEARIKKIPMADGPERQLCLKINEMIDRADAYVRESTACLGFIAENQYFRRIAEHGMLGAYGNATRKINAAAKSGQGRGAG